MRLKPLHSFDVKPKEAIKIQKELQKKLDISKDIDIDSIKTIAGSDLAYDRERKLAIASIVIMEFPSFSIIERVCGFTEITFPYIPGLLSFREIPAMIVAAEKLKTIPDIWLIDGAGIAHPRRLGLASHWGIMTEIPTVGCAKSHLYGEYEKPKAEKGSFTYIKSKDGEKIGAVLRTKKGVKPLFVSPGHLCNVESAIYIALKSCIKYRNPEPLRYAHRLADICKKEGYEAPLNYLI